MLLSVNHGRKSVYMTGVSARDGNISAERKTNGYIYTSNSLVLEGVVFDGNIGKKGRKILGKNYGKKVYIKKYLC